MGSCIAGEPVPAVSLATVTRFMTFSPMEDKIHEDFFLGWIFPVKWIYQLDFPVESFNSLTLFWLDFST